MSRRHSFRYLLGWGVGWLLLLPLAASALTWEIELAAPGRAVAYTSLTLDSQGRPHISAFDWGAQVLIYTRFDGTAWRTEVADGRSLEGPGSHSALALDSQDRPHISYVYRPIGTPDFGIRYARFDGTAWRLETLDTQDGGYTSIALDTQGRPHISYGSGLRKVLKYARFDGTTWRIETVEAGNFNGDTSLKLDAQGRPHTSYSAGQRLRYARFDGSTWRLETVEDLGFGKMVFETSLLLDAAGRPHIAYVAAHWGGGIKYARFDGTSWRIEMADPLVGRYVSLGLDRAGYPLISFYDGDMGGSLKLARFDGLTWQTTLLDTQAGADTSLKLDVQDRVHISYTGFSPAGLKYARGTPEVRLDLQLNQPSFRPGETLTLGATVSPTSPLLVADAYLALALPGGALLFFQAEGRFGEALQPFVRDWPVTAVSAELFRYTFAGGEPPGTYTWLAVLTTPGTLEFLTPLITLPFTFAP